MNVRNIKMKKYSDSFCKPIITQNGQKLAGAAAREHLIKQNGGIDNMLSIFGKMCIQNANATYVLDNSNVIPFPKTNAG